MAKRNLTVLFGADTSKLTKALGGLRKKISGAFSGMLSLKGMAAAGIGGFGISQAVGLLMNLSPAFANALLKMKEPLMSIAAKVADYIAPHLESFADWLATADLAGGLEQWWQDMQDGFDVIIDGLAGIYTATVALLKHFDGMVSTALGKAVAAGLNTEAGMSGTQAAIGAAIRGEGGLGQAKAFGQALFGNLLGQSVRAVATDSLGASDR
jgi:hypothetical protein